jgi:uncharacterized damage-inducible protein DinB
MSAESYRRLILRDVDGLKRQLQAYHDESDIWLTPHGIGNSPGNIALHVAGNLQHYIGKVLGDSDYQRDRDSEFARNNVPLSELTADLDAAAAAVNKTLSSLPDSRLTELYPLSFGDVQLITGRFLAHLCGHLAYHLGQVDYHRRITTGAGAVDGIQDFGPLVD